MPEAEKIKYSLFRLAAKRNYEWYATIFSKHQKRQGQIQNFSLYYSYLVSVGKLVFVVIPVSNRKLQTQINNLTI